MHKKIHTWDNLGKRLAKYLSTNKEEVLTIHAFMGCTNVWYSVPKDTIHLATKCGYKPRCLEVYSDKDFTVVVHMFNRKCDLGMDFVFVSKERK